MVLRHSAGAATPRVRVPRRRLRRTVRSFNPQDISNTAWAFATAGEYSAPLLDALGDEACLRPSVLNRQHVAMLLWSYITLRHRHDRLFDVVGKLAEVDRSSWSSAKLLAFALAGLPKIGALLGSRETTLKVAAGLIDALLERTRAGKGEADDAHTVHDAVFPWLDPDLRGAELPNPGGWREVEGIVEAQTNRLVTLTRSQVFDVILPVTWPAYDPSVCREYQCAVQGLGLRGLGSVCTWRLFRDIGVRRAGPDLARLALAAKRVAPPALLGQDAGRGERANWCYWRGWVRAAGPDGVPQLAEEPGRLQSSTVVTYREDCAGLVAVKLSHDRAPGTASSGRWPGQRPPGVRFWMGERSPRCACSLRLARQTRPRTGTRSSLAARGGRPTWKACWRFA